MLELLDDIKDKYNIFDNVDIIVDPELEDESTVDINNYLNKYVLQCRICGNLFPSDTLLDNEEECPICNSISNDGYIYKGKLVNNKEENKSNDEEEKQEIIDELVSNEISDENSIDTQNYSNDDDNEY